MAYDASLARRVGFLFESLAGAVEKKMFGGVVYMLRGNMCAGVWRDFLILRVGPDEYQKTLQEPHIRLMDITGRPMTGWVMVEPEGYDSDVELRRLVGLAVRFVGQLPTKATKPRKKPLRKNPSPKSGTKKAR